MRHIQRTIFTAMFVFIQALLVQAQNTSKLISAEQVFSECLSSDAGKADIANCFGKALDNCEQRFPDAAVVPKLCWEEELSLWNALLDTSYEELIADLNQREYAQFEAPVRESQDHWLEQKDMDCRLQVTSSPRTYDLIGTACQARATMRRVAFLLELTGADWTPL